MWYVSDMLVVVVANKKYFLNIFKERETSHRATETKREREACLTEIKEANIRSRKKKMAKKILLKQELKVVFKNKKRGEAKYI